MRRFRIHILLAIGLGLALRLAVAEATFPVRLVGDERYYMTVALSLSLGRGHMANLNNRAFRPPAASFLYSQFFPRGAEQSNEPWQNPLHRLIHLQVALGTLLVALTALLGRALFDERAGIAAGWITALEPTLIAYSHYLWSELLFSVLLIGALLLMLRGASGSGHKPLFWAALAGISFGAAALTREVGVGLAGSCAAWWWLRGRDAPSRRSLARGAVMLALAAAVVLPWTWRNYRVLERFVPVATNSWFSIAGGNLLESPDWLAPAGPKLRAFKSHFGSIEGEMSRFDFARALAPELIWAEQPTWILKKLVRNLALLFQPDSFLHYKVRLGAYGPLDLGTRRALVVATALSTTLVLLAAALAAVACPKRGPPALIAMIVGIVVVGHVIAISNTRQRVPFIPLFIAYAAYAMTSWPLLRNRLRGSRAGMAAALVAFYLFLCVPYAVRYSHAAATWREDTKAGDDPSVPAPSLSGTRPETQQLQRDDGRHDGADDTENMNGFGEGVGKTEALPDFAVAGMAAGGGAEREACNDDQGKLEHGRSSGEMKRPTDRAPCRGPPSQRPPLEHPWRLAEWYHARLR